MSGVRLKVCTGAGCRAWDSCQLVLELKCTSECQAPSGFEVESVSCMNSCGGGISVRTSGCNGSVFKFRTVDEALKKLDDEALLPIVTA